jgi:hypothetical protein
MDENEGEDDWEVLVRESHPIGLVDAVGFVCKLHSTRLDPRWLELMLV